MANETKPVKMWAAKNTDGNLRYVDTELLDVKNAVVAYKRWLSEQEIERLWNEEYVVKGWQYGQVEVREINDKNVSDE
jgi:hypothetical protein